MQNESVSIVLPALNEAKNLEGTIASALAAVSKLVSEFEVLVVDDGSTDATAEVCRRLPFANPSIRLCRHEQQRGYGAALRTGLTKAGCDLVFFTDADGQFSFDEIGDFLNAIDSVDMVIGYRVDRQDPWFRKVNSRIGNWIARRQFGVRARDINCAYKLLRRAALQQLPLVSNGAMINTELLAHAAREGWIFHELPVNHFPRTHG